MTLCSRFYHYVFWKVLPCCLVFVWLFEVGSVDGVQWCFVYWMGDYTVFLQSETSLCCFMVRIWPKLDFICIYYTCICTWYILGYPWLSPFPVAVTTRIIPFLVGNPYKPSFATVTGKGDNPRYITNMYMYIHPWSLTFPMKNLWFGILPFLRGRAIFRAAVC